jgi:dTDP-4-dehydrorhamnose 3,5-epimerase
MYNPAWKFSEEPLVYVYQTTIRPGQIKGWVPHLERTTASSSPPGMSRSCYSTHASSRPRSSISTSTIFGGVHRALPRIPRGVYHAIQNVGQNDALFVNMPRRPYCHEEPDKFRLPLDTAQIPYDF